MSFDRRDFVRHGGIGALGLTLEDRTRPRGGFAGVRVSPVAHAATSMSAVPATAAVPTQFAPYEANYKANVVGVPFGTKVNAAYRPYVTVDGDRTIRGYIWHCHILEHEENDMMQRSRVLDA